MSAVKTVCPIDRDTFRAHAKGLPLVVGGQPIDLEVKEFSTGSLGWYANGKVKVEINGVRVLCQVGFTLTIVGSKDLPK